MQPAWLFRGKKDSTEENWFISPFISPFFSPPRLSSFSLLSISGGPKTKRSLSPPYNLAALFLPLLTQLPYGARKNQIPVGYLANNFLGGIAPVVILPIISEIPKRTSRQKRKLPSSARGVPWEVEASLEGLAGNERSQRKAPLENR